MATDYSEILMQSMDILVAKRLSELQFDKTINCQITDTSAADKGEYEVTDGATTFTAYSRDVTYKVGDSVYVTIPNGDFDNQKQIVGKYVSPGESLNHLSPLDSYVDITGDLCNFTEEASLLANREDVLVLDKKNNIQTCETYSKQVIWKAKIQNGKGFERLGIQADFKTKLKSLKTNNGNFGLCLYVTYIDKSNVNSEDSVKTASFILDSDDMYGNPYNFNSYFTQEKVFDISSITGQITDMALVFYQDFNFTDVSGMSIPHYEIKIDPETEEEVKEYFMPNISVNNIHISMGYDISKFNEDAVLVYCLNEPTYNYNNLTQENRKTLQVRWVRVTNEGIYSIDSEKEIPENAAIHWYKYQIKIQDKVDELAGPMWFEIEEGLNKLQLDVDPDTKELTQLYKVIVEIPSRQWIEAKLDARLNDDYANLKYLAEEGADEETKQSAQMTLESYESEIKGQRKIYSSEVIEFKSEVPVVDKMTADLINGLRIEIDEKGYKGNFLLYNPSNRISNINEATKMRVMRATYKSLVTGEQTLDGAESIIWKIPLTSTMIYPPEVGKEYENDSSTSYWVENGYAYIKRMSGNSNAGSMGTVNDWSCEQKFRIKDYYQESATNNIVYCYVVKNNIAYEASAEMFFGPKSSNGTDFTFQMGFESSIPAVTRGQDDVIRINFQMFDFNNDKVPNFWQNGIDVKWYSSDGEDRIIFCNAKGNSISVENEFDFFDALDNKITTEGKVAARVKVYTNHFYIKLAKSGVPNYYVAEAFVTTDPTIKAGQAQLNHIRLSCQLLIPYRDSDVYDGIEGATKVLYSSSGTNPEFYDGRYKLWQDVNDERVQVDAGWSVVLGTSDSLGVQLKYYPRLGEGDKLLLPSIFTEGLDKRICIQAKLGNTILWSHPIVLIKDAYSSAMLNAWDGNLTINNEYGTILSTMIGAGKKELDNTFSGVLMGDVSCAIDDVTTLGLYGFNHNYQSFGWTVDGKGFIGKTGQGQILFDGNKGTISSGAWRTSGGIIGMEIDLDGPTPTDTFGNIIYNKVSTGSTLKMKGLAGEISFDTSAQSGATKLFVVKGRLPDNNDFTNPVYNNGIAVNENNKTTTVNNGVALKYKDLIKITIDTQDSDGANLAYGQSAPKVGTDAIAQSSSFYLQSLNFEAGKSGTRLDLQNGKYTSFGTQGRVEIATSSNTFFRLADADNNVLFIIKANNNDGDGDNDAATVSKYYLQSSTFNAGDNKGTRLDLENGKYTSYGAQGRVVIDSNSTTVFRIDYRNGDDTYVNLMKIGGGAYWLRSLDYGKPDVASGTCLNLENGTFETYNVGGKIIMKPNDPTAIFTIKDKDDKTLMRVGNGDNNYYLQSSDYSGGTTGMRIDLSNGKMISKNSGGTITIDPSSSLALFKIQNSGGNPLMNVGTDEYFLQSAEYEMSTPSNTGKGFKLDLKSGYINASDFKLFAKDTNGYIQIGTGNDFAIDVNGKFQVDWEGNTHLRGSAALYVESGTIYSGKKDGSGDSQPGKYYKFTQDGGTIAGWTIDEKKIFTTGEYNSEIGAEGTILLDGITWTLDFSGTDFSIFKHGSDTWNASNTHLAFNSTGMHMQVLEHSKFDFDLLGCHIDANSPGGHIVMRLGSAEFGESAYYASEVNFACNGAQNIFRLSDSYFYVSGDDNDLWLDGAGLEINLVQKPGFAAPALTLSIPELIINGSTGKTESVEFDPGPGLGTLYLNFVNGIFINATTTPAAPPAES